MWDWGTAPEGKTEKTRQVNVMCDSFNIKDIIETIGKTWMGSGGEFAVTCPCSFPEFDAYAVHI